MKLLSVIYLHCVVLVGYIGCGDEEELREGREGIRIIFRACTTTICTFVRQVEVVGLS
jgi:hypothetical protein